MKSWLKVKDRAKLGPDDTDDKDVTTLGWIV